MVHKGFNTLFKVALDQMDLKTSELICAFKPDVLSMFNITSVRESFSPSARCKSMALSPSKSSCPGPLKPAVHIVTAR